MRNENQINSQKSLFWNRKWGIALSILLITACGSQNNQQEIRQKNFENAQAQQSEYLKKVLEVKEKAQAKRQELLEKARKQREEELRKREEIIAQRKGLHGIVTLKGKIVRSKSKINAKFDKIFTFKNSEKAKKAPVKVLAANKNFNARISATTKSEIRILKELGDSSEVHTLGCIDDDMDDSKTEDFIVGLNENLKEKVQLKTDVSIDEISNYNLNADGRRDSNGHWASLEGRRIKAHTVVLCGDHSNLDFLEITAVRVILQDFVYEMNGNAGYQDFYLMADEVYLSGVDNLITSRANEDQLERAPVIHMEVRSHMDENNDKGKLRVESYGAGVE